MPEYKRKALHYRKISGLHGNRTLQGLLTPLLSGPLRKVKDRYQEVGETEGDADLRRCINRRQENDGMLFGEFILFLPNTNQQIVTRADESEELPVDQVEPPQDEEGRRREFLDSVLYFGVKDNHLVVMQSQALKADHLEHYLNWLLGSDKTKVLQPGEGINLIRGISVEGKNVLNNVRSVTLGTPLWEDVRVEQENDSNNQKRSTVTVIGLGIDLLRQIIGQDVLDDIEEAHIHQANNLEVQLRVVRRHGMRTSGPENASERVMTALTEQLRHQREDDVTVETPSHGKIKGSKLFLKTERSVTCSNGVPLIDRVFLEIGAWLGECIQDDLVSG